MVDDRGLATLEVRDRGQLIGARIARDAGDARCLHGDLAALHAELAGDLGKLVEHRERIEVAEQQVASKAEHDAEARGRRVFPFTRVRVHVVAAPRERESRARLEAVVAGPPSLADRLADRLHDAGCPRVALTTEIVYEKQRGPEWEDARFHVSFDREPAAPRSTSPASAAGVALAAARTARPPSSTGSVPRLKLTVVKGSAAQRVYVFNGGRIDIGRRADVVDQHQRLIRTNHVAFTEEGAEENRSVSRRHAHIEFSASEGGYRLWDDRIRELLAE